MIKKLINIVIIACMILLHAAPTYAASVVEVVSPTSWQQASGDFLAYAEANTTLPNVTIASRNLPGIVINPGLDSPEPVGGSGNEFSIITMPSVDSTCSDDTPVNISVSSYTRALIAEDASPDNDSYTINGGLIDLSGPTVAGYSIDDLTEIGAYSDSGVQNLSTTVGNLSNVASFVNFESTTFTGGNHYQGTAELGLPTITLTYDNSACSINSNISPTTASQVSVLAETGENRQVIYMAVAVLVIAGMSLFGLRKRFYNSKNKENSWQNHQNQMSR